jgi:hypothetical protein
VSLALPLKEADPGSSESRCASDGRMSGCFKAGIGDEKFLFVKSISLEFKIMNM